MLDRNDTARLDGAGDAYHVSGVGWRHLHGADAARFGTAESDVFSACAAAAFYRRADVLAAGGFDESLFCYLEDVDLGFRLRLLGHSCLYLPECVVLHAGSGIAGFRSEFQTYHGHRNLEWVFWKNVPGALLPVCLPAHVLLMAMTMIVCAFRGDLRIFLRAKRDAWRGMARVWRQRAHVQRTRLRSAREVWALLDKGLWRTGRHALWRSAPL
jgi:GT2 family glycosyltransferase